MKDMEKIITGILIIAFFGWLIMDNCCTEKEGCVADCTKECCDDSECGADCAKACCLGCKATDGDAKCKKDHSCCVEDNGNDSTDVTGLDTGTGVKKIILKKMDGSGDDSLDDNGDLMYLEE